jgi:Zn-dependent protease
MGMSFTICYSFAAQFTSKRHKWYDFTMLELLFQNPFAFIVAFGGLVIAIGIHEAAHCYMADYLGDPTPRALGRTTLNPLVHLDLMGTLMILITGRFGWGKPAPFDPYNLQNPRRDTALIALAGPASNIVMAIGLSLVFHLLSNLSILGVLRYLISLNINLALFNLIPVPPLDGSKIFLKSDRSSVFGDQWINIFILVFLVMPLAGYIISPISGLLLNFLI